MEERDDQIKQLQSDLEASTKRVAELTNELVALKDSHRVEMG